MIVWRSCIESRSPILSAMYAFRQSCLDVDAFELLELLAAAKLTDSS